MAHHPINSQALQAFTVPKDIYNAISNAAQKTGVNFTYLMENAAAESSFNPNAKSKSSSAAGLFQFIESTWMQMMREHGAKYGLEKYADKIGNDNKVSDSKTRNEILALRKDPEISSLMAAEFASGNYEHLKTYVGGEIGSAELGMAHFLGANGASSFLNAMKKSPNMAAADLFPREARANRNVFYDQKTGAPKSMREVYASFDKKFDGVIGNNTSMVASNDAPQNFARKSYARSAEARPAQNSVLRQQAAMRIDQDDALARLSSLMNVGKTGFKSGGENRTANSGQISGEWQIFPSSLYGNLSLSPAQLMMLSAFNA
ncbi:MAG: hypothetical protein DI626_03805 [Micavibrio aeruginosavorus]|uniref:Transglycosylase SLT domain-containing protein n=1 Tax=Micavibrio aeruginosavorus TaxID=349221 RepID=A0A2W5A4Y6_9BACT|nr:MAG: hypothetical protein DI626_03805 [Micavibrio aeruginosavorus]